MTNNKKSLILFSDFQSYFLFTFTFFLHKVASTFWLLFGAFKK